MTTLTFESLELVELCNPKGITKPGSSLILLSGEEGWEFDIFELEITKGLTSTTSFTFSIAFTSIFTSPTRLIIFAVVTSGEVAGVDSSLIFLDGGAWSEFVEGEEEE